MDAREMLRFLIEEPTVFDYLVMFAAGFVSGMLCAWLVKVNLK